MKKLHLAMVLAAGMFAQSALAATAPLNLGEIKAQQQEIRAGVMAGTGRYKDMPETTKDELLAQQGRLLRMIEGKQDPSELTDDQRVEAFNILEAIEATINHAEDDQMVCVREKRTGSLQVVRVCRTQRDIREARDRARRQMVEGSSPLDI